MKIEIRGIVVQMLPKEHDWSSEKHRCACFFVALLLMLCNSSVLAEGAVDTSKEKIYSDMSLDELMGLEVFSAASRIPTKQTQAPGTVYSFEREDFARMGVRRVDDLLQFVPGMQINQYALF